MALTREQKMLWARRLRREGLTAKEIAERVGACESTVRNWYLGADCELCGRPLDGGNGAKSSTRCGECRYAEAVERDEAIVARWNEGATLTELAEEFGGTQQTMNGIIGNRRVAGWDVRLATLPHGDWDARYEQVAEWVRSGLTNQEIADRLGTTRGSVAEMVKNVRRKGYDAPYRKELALA